MKKYVLKKFYARWKANDFWYPQKLTTWNSNIILGEKYVRFCYKTRKKLILSGQYLLYHIYRLYLSEVKVLNWIKDIISGDNTEIQFEGR